MRKTIVGLALFAGVCSSAFAYSECWTRLNKVYVGDSGTLVMELENAPVASVASTNPSFKLISAAALVAVNSDKNVGIRYAADGVQCTRAGATQTQVLGLWIMNR